MQITFLGTSSGTPTKRRNVSGIALNLENRREWVLIDCGEGTQHRLLHTPLSLVKLQAILITHMHGDHCYGLPGLLASAQLSGRTAPLTLMGPSPLWGYLKAVMQHTALDLSYEIELVAVDRGPLCAKIAGMEVTSVPLSHRVPSYGFRFKECTVERTLLVDLLNREGIASGPEWGRLQKGEKVKLQDGRILDGQRYSKPSREARVVVIGGDNDRPELLGDLCKGADLLVHEATYTEQVAEKLGPEPQHSSAASVARFAQSAKLPALILTHFSPRYQTVPGKGTPLAELRQEAEYYYHGDLYLADDLQQYCLMRDKTIQVSSLWSAY